MLRLDPAARSRYEAGLYLDYSAPTDDKPFFMHFYKWGSLFKHAKFDARYVEATGNFVLLAGLAFAVVGAMGLIAAPAFVAAYAACQAACAAAFLAATAAPTP